MPSIKKKSKTRSKTKSKKKRKPTTQSSLTRLDPTYDEHKLKGYLEKKMKPWYSKLSEGNLLIIKKNGTYTIISSTTDMLTKWKQSGEDKTIQYILWTTPGMGSSQHMEMFIDYIVETKSNKIIEEMIRSKHTLPILVKHFTKLCSKYPIHTKKDYFLNQYEYPWIQSAKKKEAADIKNKKKLLKKLTKSTLIKTKL